MSHTKLPLENGTAYGQLALPGELPDGTYHLRAYTQWMLNFPSEGIFYRSLTIHGNTHQNNSPSQTPETDIQLRFFPEGGNLIEGLLSKVAFEATDMQGNGREVSGYILDETGDSIQHFTTMHQGKGTFLFQPQAGKRYRAYLHGSPTAYPLPEQQTRGFVLSSKTLQDVVRITLRNNMALTGKEHAYTLVLHQEGTVTAQWPVSTDKDYQYLDLPIELLPTGIFYLTLIDESYRAYCERLLFVRFPETTNLQLDTQCIDEDGRRKMRIRLTGNEEKPLIQKGSFSIAMVKAGLDSPTVRNDLRTYLFIDSRLKGSIAPATEYWQPDDPECLSRINLLLLTHGWRRYTLDEATQPFTQPTYPMEQGLTLTGKVNGITAKKAPKASVTAILDLDSTRQVLTSAIDSKKRFSLTASNFYDEHQILLSAHNGKNEMLPISIDPTPSAPSVPHVLLAPRIPSSAHETNTESIAPQPVSDGEKRINLDEVKIVARKKDPMEKIRSYSEGFVLRTMDVQEEQAHGDVRELLKRMPGVTMISNPNRRKGGNQMVAHINGTPNRSTATLVVDGFVARDNESVYSMEASRVSRIEVLNQTSTQFGGFITGGVIAIYTRPSRGIEVKTEQLLLTWKGFSQQKEFYQPLPNDKAFFDKPQARNCVYWNPNVSIDSTGTATLSFYLNEHEIGTYLIHCEGYSEDGKVGSETLTVEIGFD